MGMYQPSGGVKSIQVATVAAANGTANNVTISAVNTAKAVIIPAGFYDYNNLTFSGDTANLETHYGQWVLTSATNVRFVRGSAYPDSRVFTASCTVVEYP